MFLKHVEDLLGCWLLVMVLLKQYQLRTGTCDFLDRISLANIIIKTFVNTLAAKDRLNGRVL